MRSARGPAVREADRSVDTQHMNLYFRSNRIFFRLLPALLLGIAVQLPSTNAADEPETAPDLSEQRQVLEMDLVRLYTLIQQDVDATTKTTLLGHHKELTGRANRLLEKFDPAKYDELRYDINIQCQRLARKQAALLSPPASPNPDRVPDIAVYELSPSPTDPAEVKAALDVVDLTIKRLENRLSRLTVGSVEYLREREKIQRIKDHRVTLGKGFTQARWDSLAAELRPQGQ